MISYIFKNPNMTSILYCKYNEYLTQRYSKCIIAFHVFIFLNLISILSFMANSVYQKQEFFYFPFNKILVFLIIGLIWLVFFLFCFIWIYTKRRNYSDILLLINYFYFCAIAAELLKHTNENPLLGYGFSTTNLIYIISYRCLFVKLLHMTGNMFFMMIYYWDLGFEYREALLIQCFFSTVLLMVFFYYIQKGEMENFINSSSFEKEKKTFAELLNILPEGAGIFSKSMKVLLVNNSMKILFDEFDLIKLKEKLFRETIKKSGDFSDRNSDNFYENPAIEIQPLSNKKQEISLEANFLQFTQQFSDKQLEVTQKSNPRFHNSLGGMLESRKGINGLNKLETFTAQYCNKTLLIKMLSIPFNSKESVLILANDATESVRLRALEDTNEYKNNLFASFTHEFKTPLNCLFVMLHSLLIEGRIPKELKEAYLKPALYNSQILFDLVNAVSDYSLLTLRKFKLERKTIILKDFFEKSLQPLFYQAKQKNLMTKVIYAEDLPKKIKTDPRRLQQILFQLYSNAIKFTYSGSIIIKVKCDKLLNSGVKISVIDTGIGISNEDKAELEEKLNGTNNLLNFRKTSNNSTGASLGLTVSQQIAKILGFPRGKGIECKSLVGKGSKFFLTIKNSVHEISKEFISNSGTLGKPINKNALEFIESPFNIPKIMNKSQNSIANERETASKPNFTIKYEFLDEKIMNSTPKHVQNLVKCAHEPALIVDDNEFNILALSTLLHIKGVSSLSARNGEIALNLIKSECFKRSDCCEGFKIIFMDLNMPVLDGIDTALQLKASFERKELPFMPIIACTAYESDKKEQCFAAGMVDFTGKPLDIERVRHLIDKWVL